MSELRTYDNAQLLHHWPQLPHLDDEVVCFVGNFDNRRYPHNERYFNRELMLVLLTAGHSEIRLNGRPVSLSAGTVLLHGPDYLTDHRSLSSDLEYMALSLSESLWAEEPALSRIVAQLLLTMRRDDDCTLRLSPYAAEHLRSELEALMSLLDSDHRFLRRRVQVHCEALLLDVADWLSHKTVVREHVSRRDRLLREFHVLATKHFREEHSVGFYADRLAVSRQYLTRVLRAETGRSVNEILSELQLMEARNLLLTTTLQVGEVAAQLGFGDAAVFCKFFRRHVGCTPLAFRRSRGV